MMIVSLAMGFLFISKDPETSDQSKTLTLLKIRVTLAAIIVILTAIGLYTGQLTINPVPWSP